MSAETFVERQPVRVRITYKNNNPDFPELNLYTEAALNQVPPEELQMWEHQGESPVGAEMVRSRTESKFPAGFRFTFNLLSNDLSLARVIELLRSRHHELLDDFLKCSWPRIAPGLPPGNDFPLCFPARAFDRPRGF